MALLPLMPITIVITLTLIAGSCFDVSPLMLLTMLFRLLLLMMLFD